MKKTFSFLIVMLFAFSSQSFADSKNVIKTSVVPIFLKNYSLYYERGIHKNLSFSIGGTYMPERGLPGLVTDMAGGNSGAISSVKFTGLSLTPELRIFPGLKVRKQAPHGFYISLYAKLSAYQVDFPYTYTDNSSTTVFDFSGKYNGIGIGMMLGRQWIIGDHFSIDWWISGAHFGSLNSVLEVTNSKLSSVDQSEFIQKLNDISFPLGEVNTEVSGNTSKVIIDAPFVGFRSGFTLGIAF